MSHSRFSFSRFAAVLWGPAALLASLSVRAAEPRETSPQSEEERPPRTMSLSEVLAYAHAHQPAIRVALSRVAARLAEASVPSAQWRPTLGATVQVYEMTANNTTGAYLATPFLDLPRIGGTAAQSSSSASLAPSAATLVGIGLEQEVFDFGRVGAQAAAADELVSVERHRADAVRLDVDFGVEEAYFSVLAARAIVVAADGAQQRSLLHRDLAKRAVDAGLRSPIELTRAAANLAHFEVGRIQARGGLALAQNVLAAAIGSAEPAIDAVTQAPTLGEMPTIARAIQMVEARDPVLAEAIEQLRASEQETRAIGAQLQPNLSLTVTLSARAGGAPPSSSSQPTPPGSGWVPDVPNWDVGLVFLWPLSQGTIAARHDAARAAEQVRRDEVDVVRQREIVRVRLAYAHVGVARAELAALDSAAVAARANYDQADARFRAGMGDGVELADAEALRTDAEIDQALGEFRLAQTRADFGRAIAEGL